MFGMKVIFLDIDGVLVTRSPGVFDADLVMNLKSVVEATGAQIVLSSDWRRERYSLEQARRNLQAYGLDFISSTPCLSPYLMQRPTEILQWKDEYYRSGQISAWLAIDDRNLLEEQSGYQLHGHFVRTNPRVGLDRAAALECIQLLQQEPADRYSPADHYYSPQNERLFSNSDRLISNSWIRSHATVPPTGGLLSFDTYGQERVMDTYRKRASFDSYAPEAYGGFRVAGDLVDEPHTPTRDSFVHRPVWARVGSDLSPRYHSDYIGCDYLHTPSSVDRLSKTVGSVGPLRGDFFGSIDNVFRVWDTTY